MNSSSIIDAKMQLTSGATAGFVEIILMHPLDVVKTRLQLQRNVAKGHPEFTEVYSGIFDCFKKMCKSEGVLSLWKGIIPPIFVEAPKRSVKFFTFEKYTQIFRTLDCTANNQEFFYTLAGLLTGITEAVLINPAEVIKIAMQSDRAKYKDLPRTSVIARRIWANEGFNGFTKGLSATICRNGLFNMVYFGFYHSVKDYLKVDSNGSWQFCKKLSIGFTSGVLASCINIPFDVVKSRIQGPQPVLGVVKYSSTLLTLRTIYKEEGFRALYKGLLPKVLRLGPGGAIMLVVYDYMYNFLITVQFG